MNDTGANLDIVAVSRGLNASGVLTDSLTGCSSPCNTWVPFASYVNSGGASPCTSNCGIIQIYYCSPCTTGANHVFTVGAAGSTVTRPSIIALGYSGAASSSPADQHNGNTFNGGSGGSTGSVTPTVTNELVVSCMGAWVNGVPYPAVPPVPPSCRKLR